jgi:hypothetical protein
MPTIYGPSADIDGGQAYFFQCDDNGLFAISRDRSGRNLPPGPCAEGWQFLMEFALGIHEPVPVPIDPEPVMRGLRNVGYYVWRDGAYHPRGSSQ